MGGHRQQGVTGVLDDAHATALVSCTPLGTLTFVTPEQRAEILAMTRGYRDINLRRDPIDARDRLPCGLGSRSQPVRTSDTRSC